MSEWLGGRAACKLTARTARLSPAELRLTLGYDGGMFWGEMLVLALIHLAVQNFCRVTVEQYKAIPESDGVVPRYETVTVGRGVSRTGRYCLPKVPPHVCSHALPP
jgi:hypothetical protein